MKFDVFFMQSFRDKFACYNGNLFPCVNNIDLLYNCMSYGWSLPFYSTSYTLAQFFLLHPLCIMSKFLQNTLLYRLAEMNCDKMKISKFIH